MTERGYGTIPVPYPTLLASQDVKRTSPEWEPQSAWHVFFAPRRLFDSPPRRTMERTLPSPKKN
eukprot:scaffold6474_cov189-Amphora_coffeaeformis.AAC.6